MKTSTEDSLQGITHSEVQGSAVMLPYSHLNKTVQTQVIDMCRGQVLDGSVQDLYKTFPRETSMSELKVGTFKVCSLQYNSDRKL